MRGRAKDEGGRAKDPNNADNHQLCQMRQSKTPALGAGRQFRTLRLENTSLNPKP
jgi:hypothetical protein